MPAACSNRCCAVFVAAAVLLLTPTPATATDDCDGRACIQIGTFNLDDLGSGGTGAEPLRSQAAVERLADLVAELGLDVVVFQEVNSSVSINENGVQTASPQQWQWLKTALKKAGYKTIAGSGSQDRHLVIAYAKKVVKLRAKQSLLVSSTITEGAGCSATNLPFPQAATFKADDLEFRVVGVQMVPQGSDRACSDRIRATQTEQLVGALGQLRSDDVQTFLIGDFGAKAKHKSLSALREDAGYKELTAKKARAAGSGKVSALASPRGLFDHVFYVQSASRDTWVPKSTLVFDPTKAGDLYAAYLADYSDHAPVLTALFVDDQ